MKAKIFSGNVSIGGTLKHIFLLKNPKPFKISKHNMKVMI